MKSKKVRIGMYWLRVYLICGEIRMEGGHNEFREYPEKRYLSLLAGSKSQINKLREFAKAILKVTDQQIKEEKEVIDMIGTRAKRSKIFRKEQTNE